MATADRDPIEPENADTFGAAMDLLAVQVRELHEFLQVAKDTEPPPTLATPAGAPGPSITESSEPPASRIVIRIPTRRRFALLLVIASAIAGGFIVFTTLQVSGRLEAGLATPLIVPVTSAPPRVQAASLRVPALADTPPDAPTQTLATAPPVPPSAPPPTPAVVTTPSLPVAPRAVPPPPPAIAATPPAPELQAPVATSVVSATVKAQILDADARWFSAYYRSDQSTLQRLTSDGFRQVDLRAAAERLAPGTVGVLRTVENIGIDVEGEALVLSGRMTEFMPSSGMRTTTTFSEVWLASGKDWRLLGLRLTPAGGTQAK